MILYFSATGNTKYAAQKLASLLEDEPLDLLERIKNTIILRSDPPSLL